VLGVERFRGVLGRRHVDGFVPPQVAALGPRRVNSGAPHHKNVLYRVLLGGPGRRYGLVDRLLQRYRLTAPVLPVGGDDELGLGVFNAG
jgi:hypothetical protein